MSNNSLININILDGTGAVSGVNLNSIEIYINGDPAFNNESFISPFDGGNSNFSYTSTIEGDGYNIIIDPINNFNNYELVEIRVVAEDNVFNSLDEYYYFKVADTIEPIFSNISPAQGSVVSENTLINFSVTDAYSGIQRIDAYVDGSTAILNNVFISPFDGPSSSITFNGVDGYDVIIDLIGDYPSGQEISVIFNVLDNEGN